MHHLYGINRAVFLESWGDWRYWQHGGRQKFHFPHRFCQELSIWIAWLIFQLNEVVRRRSWSWWHLQLEHTNLYVMKNCILWISSYVFQVHWKVFVYYFLWWFVFLLFFFVYPVRNSSIWIAAYLRTQSILCNETLKCCSNL